MAAEDTVIIEFVADTSGLNIDEISKGIDDELKKVGNNPNFLKGVSRGIDEATKEFADMAKAAGKDKTEVDKLAASMNNLSKGIAGGAIKQGAKTFQEFGTNLVTATKNSNTLTTQLRAMRNELAGLDEGSQRFKELSIQAAKLQDKIGDVNNQVRTLASDTFAFDALTDGARLITGGFAAAQGAAALFGNESEDLQKIMLKTQGALALLNGTQEIANFLTGQSAAKLAIVSAAQKVYTFVTQGATLATRLLNAAIVGLGAGILIAGVTLLISKMFELGEETKKTTDTADKAKEAYAELAKVRNDFIKGFATNLTNVDAVIARLQEQNVSIEEQSELFDKLKHVSDNYFGSLKAGTSTIDDIRKAADRFAKAISVQAEIEKLTKQIEPLQLSLFGLRNALAATNAPTPAFVAGVQKDEKALKELLDQLNALQLKLKQLGGDPADGFKEVEKAADKAARSIEKSIENLNNIDPDQIPELEVKIAPKIDDKTIQELQDDLNKRLADAEAERQQIIKQTAISAAQETFDAIFAIGAQNRQAQLDADLSALDKRREAELSNKDLTENQKKAIDAKFRQEERQIKIKAFESDKQAALAEAAMNGAVAITKTYFAYGFTPAGIAAAILQAVATASQIAIIANRKPPAFKKGTKSAPGGMALVGEEGAELMHVPKGAQIIPHAETLKVLSGHSDTNDILQRFGIPITSPKVTELRKEFKDFDYGRLEKIINKPQTYPQVVIDKEAIVRIYTQERSSREYVANRYSAR